MSAGNRPKPTLRAVSIAATLACALAGCKSSTPAPAAQSKPLDPATLGTVSGQVKFSGTAPARVPIDVSMDPACSLSGGNPLSEQLVVADGNVANVYVYIKSGPAAAMAAGQTLASAIASAAPALLDQTGCVYTPHVLAIMAGGAVAFRNNDPTMHNVHVTPTVAGNPVVDLSEGPRGKPQEKTFPQPELMIPVRCNNHPWMNAFIDVAATPWFAVTGPDGRFQLKGVPAGDYTLAVVQEKLGEQTMQITVKPQAATTADFTYTMK